jgi:hypothetical protein
VRQFLAAEERTLTGSAARVPDHPGAPTRQRDGLMTPELEAPERTELEEIAHVEAGRSRVEPDVHGEAAGVEPRLEGRVGGLVNEAAPAQVGGQCGHRVSLP